MYDLYFNYDIEVLSRLIEIMKSSISKEDIYKTNKEDLYYFKLSNSEKFYISIILESIYGRRKNLNTLVGIALTRLCVTYGKASLKLAKVSTSERSRIWNNLHNEIKLQLNKNDYVDIKQKSRRKKGDIKSKK